MLWATASVAAVLLSAPAAGLADLLEDPPHELASVLPDPLPDPFYLPAPGFEKSTPGTVLANRPAGVDFPPTAHSIELLVRSTDTGDRPVPVVVTLFVPNTPWPGPGPRPLVAYAPPISALGNTCVPSQKMKEGVQADQLAIAALLARDSAVVVPDYQGPRQAYSAGHMEGHAVLDAIRAATRLGVADLRPDSPVALTGYSGGAIATGWAAQLAPRYAPELHVAGALIGGTPADYRMLWQSMNGNAAAGVFLSAALGLAREYPELLTLLNDSGWRLAHTFRNVCVEPATLIGLLTRIRVEQLTDLPDPIESPIVRRIITENRLGATMPAAPILIYHGADEIFVPLAGAQNLYRDWCRQHARVRLDILPGGHFLVGVRSQATPQIADWVDEMFAGTLVPPGCTSSD
ncbi:lipase family protein [Nocardia aurantia]|uniref:Putative inactive lipase n=1 Tax=Nocardia aurantia TaxID=2585199 RepID=A0A7K0DPJ6_9NOCA|nr:lipase family protein [Nocardia aurantia]MQY27686.1 putative inactive lipase [Nocardia aurantia]